MGLAPFTVSGIATAPGLPEPVAINEITVQVDEQPPVRATLKHIVNLSLVEVTFTATDHSSGNKQLAGLIIAAGSGANKTEAALLSDSANNFGNSINPMLSKLFAVWHPAGGMTSAPAAKSSPSDSTAVQAAGHSGKVPPLHTVIAPDNSASISVPDGRQLDPTAATDQSR